MIAAIYARKSTAQLGRSDEEKSVTRQIENARAFAAEKGWTVAEEHVYADDAESGAEITKLRAKQRLLDLIRSGDAPFQLLIMQKSDRLSRRDGAEALVELKSIAKAVRCSTSRTRAALEPLVTQLERRQKERETLLTAIGAAEARQSLTIDRRIVEHGYWRRLVTGARSSRRSPTWPGRGSSCGSY